uniref:Uncharacterized protein n=1 Tax=Neogobius melanostomus TaxID=47308 RepID=A0A8C6S683_9GOBI
MRGRSHDPNFHYSRRTSDQEVNVAIGNHRVHIPSSALKMSQGHESDVRLVVTVINSTFFEQGPKPTEAAVKPSFILDTSVLVVKAGTQHVKNLTEPVKLLFKLQNQKLRGVCVFWKDSDVDEEAGNWSADGCNTDYNGTDFICSCNHLSFFAVLVNPAITVDEKNALNLTYISYFGSAFSVFFTLISFILYICLHQRRPEKAHGIHIQLAGAMLCLHLAFLLCSLLLWYHPEIGDGALCKPLGLILHWSLLATFSWMALEGFHLYLLLVRVFNIYVRRYVLKISLFGWGFPTLVVAVCGIADIYGKYTLNITGASNQNSPGQICWIRNHMPHSLIANYVTSVAYPCLVILYNGTMLGMVVCQLWRLRRADYGLEGSGSWKMLHKERLSRLWKDSVTVLGLSCVLGLPWALAGLTYITYISTEGIYVFTIFNALQGFLLFLWCLAVRSKSKSEINSSVRDQSSQKMIDTSL